MELRKEVKQRAAELSDGHAENRQSDPMTERDPPRQYRDAVKHLRYGKGKTADKHSGKQSVYRLTEDAYPIPQRHFLRKPALPPRAELAVPGENAQDTACHGAEYDHLFI